METIIHTTELSLYRISIANSVDSEISKTQQIYKKLMQLKQ